ncbi:MAG: type II secretion system protein [Calditrichaeota bacterium]|nr:type II secretion system protein [Calditrichota bacterium]
MQAAIRGRRSTQQSGFTMIELVVAIVLVTIFSVFLGRLLLSGVDAFNFANERKTALRRARIALLEIARDVRQIKSRTSIALAQSDSLVFTTVTDELVRYGWNGSRLSRNGTPLALNVASFSFTYYTEDGTPLQSPVLNTELIRVVDVHLTIQVSDQHVSLQTRIHPRNL